MIVSQVLKYSINTFQWKLWSRQRKSFNSLHSDTFRHSDSPKFQFQFQFWIGTRTEWSGVECRTGEFTRINCNGKLSNGKCNYISVTEPLCLLFELWYYFFLKKMSCPLGVMLDKGRTKHIGLCWEFYLKAKEH